MYAEDDWLPLSGLQHLLFCARQCALIHVEGIWDENERTVEGGQLHGAVDLPGASQRPGVRVVRGLPLRSAELGLSGRADVVEFPTEAAGAPLPVEYKRGRRRRWLHDEVQLCAQAMALEEMLGCVVPRGAIFYGRSHRRRDVELGPALRAETTGAADRFHDMVRRRYTPVASLEPKCRSCSLRDACQPAATGDPGQASRYLSRLILGEDEGGP